MRRLLVLPLALAAACHEGKPTPQPNPAPPAKKDSQAAPQEKWKAEDADYILDLADVKLKHGKLDEALQLFHEVQRLTKEPDVAGRAAYGIALVHVQKNEPKLALGPLSAAIAAAAPGARTELRLLLSQLQADLGDAAAAEAALDAILREPDLNAQTRLNVHNRIFALYQKRNDLPALAAKLEKQADREAWELLGLLYARHLNDPARALAAYEKLAALDPENLGALQAVMEAAAIAGKPELALEAMEKLLAKIDRPAQVRVLSLLGSIFVQKKDPERAIAVLDRAERLCATPQDQDPVRVTLYAALKDTGKLAARVEALNAKPEDESSLRGLLLIHQRFDGATARAEEVLAKLLAMKPDDPAYLAASVDLARQRGDHERVAAQYEKLFAVDVASAAEVIETYWNALLMTGRIERGLQTVLKAKEHQVPILAKSGDVLYRAGKPEPATSLWRTMLGLVRSGKNAAEYLVAVRVLKGNGLNADALELAKESFQLPADASVQAELVLLAADLLEPAQAEAVLRDLLRRSDLPDGARQAAQKKLASVKK